MSPGRFAAALIACTAVGAALRFGLVAATHPVGLQGDEYYYVQVATRLAQYGQHYAPSLKGNVD